MNKGSLQLCSVLVRDRGKHLWLKITRRVKQDLTVPSPNTFSVIVCDMQAVASVKENIEEIHKVKSKLFMHVCCCSGIANVCNSGVYFCIVIVRFLMTYILREILGPGGSNVYQGWLSRIQFRLTWLEFFQWNHASYSCTQSGQSSRAHIISVTKSYDHKYTHAKTQLQDQWEH